MKAGMRNSSALFLLLSLLSNTGCMLGGGTVQVAAPPAPAPLLPRELDPLPLAPAAGLTRVVLDADGRRATVTEVLSWNDSQARAVGTSLSVTEHGEHSRPICITPCEFDFEPGLHVLRLDAGPARTETVRLQVGSKRKLLRVAVGYDIPGPRDGTTGVVLQVLGASAAVVGAILWAASSSAPADSRESLASTGIALTLAGSAGFLLGIPLAYQKPRTRQPSSITEVDLPTAP
jgi:hypothetical protein